MGDEIDAKGFLFPAARREFDRQTRGEVVRLTSRLAVRAEDAQHHRNEDQQFGSAGCPRAARPAQSTVEDGGRGARQNGRPPMASPSAVSRIQPSWTGSFLAIPGWPMSSRPAPALVP